MRQDVALVDSIAEYRLARAATEAMNDEDRKRGFETIQRNPGMLRALAYMARAQQGKALEAPTKEIEREGMAVAQDNRTTTDQESDA